PRTRSPWPGPPRSPDPRVRAGRSRRSAACTARVLLRLTDDERADRISTAPRKFGGDLPLVRHSVLTMPKLLVLSLLAGLLTPCPPAAAVTTTDGPVHGTVTSDYASYQGIPYAAPPVGPLRWRPPQPV